MSVIDVLSEFADVEWARQSLQVPDPGSAPQVPFFVWRFKNRNERLERAIAVAVSCYQGTVQWDAYVGGRNWVIAPRRLREFQAMSQYQSDSEAKLALARDDPEFCAAASADTASLAKHIRRELNRDIS